jgi:N6-L-threonylcarbamoyladenine synthase
LFEHHLPFQYLTILMGKNVDIVLGIETSCDETSVAVLDKGRVQSNIISSQIVHKEYGGVVPELASRAHLKMIIPVMQAALDQAGVSLRDIEAVAAVYGPGLVGSLLVGLNFGKSLAWSLGIPFIGVNHMEGHIYSTFLEDEKPVYPFICLTVSGGHTDLIYIREPLTYQLMGRTRDDAAGEAFDKVAKMLGIGYPGGPVIDKLARDGNPRAVHFPRAYAHAEHYDFSFSGLKTSVLYYLRGKNLLASDGTPAAKPPVLNDICASFQEAVVDTLLVKTRRAAAEKRVGHVAVAGGVSANSRLREAFINAAATDTFKVYFPLMEYCTDNAAMAAYAGWLRLLNGETSPVTLTAVPNLNVA